MASNQHEFTAYVQKIAVGDKDTKVTLLLSTESDDAYTLTTLIDYKRRGLLKLTAESLQPTFAGDDAGWDLPRPASE